MTAKEIEAKIEKLPSRKMRGLVRELAIAHYDDKCRELQKREEDLRVRGEKWAIMDREIEDKKRKIEEAEKASAKRVKLGEAIESLMAEFASAQMRAYMSERRMGW